MFDVNGVMMTKRPRPYYVLTHPQVGEQQGFHDNGTGGKNEGDEETGGDGGGVQSAPLSLALQV